MPSRFSILGFLILILYTTQHHFTTHLSKIKTHQITVCFLYANFSFGIEKQILMCYNLATLWRCIMVKQNWLDLITKEEVAEFAQKHLGPTLITELEKAVDLNYGRFFQVRGLTEPAVNGWGKPASMMNEIALGNYGPLDVDPYGETTVDDMGKLFSEDENLINIYLAWIAFVSGKNQGRTLDGKTYTESFTNACNAQIDLKKTAQIRDAEREAHEKKSCVKAFVGQLESAKTADEKSI